MLVPVGISVAAGKNRWFDRMGASDAVRRRFWQIVIFLASHEGQEFTVDEISEHTGMSERTIRRYISHLVKEGVVQTAVRKGQVYYFIPTDFMVSQKLESFIRQFTHPYERLAEVRGPPEAEVYGTKIEEIASRYAFLKDVREFGGKHKLKEAIQIHNPREALREIIDAVESNDFKLPKFVNERELKNLEVTGDSFITHIDDLPLEEVLTGLMIGTDASKEETALAVSIIGVPVMMNLTFSGAAAYMVEYESGDKKRREDGTLIEGIVRRPRFPMTAAEEYLEELSTRFPELGPYERGLAAYIYMDRVHFTLDQDMLSRNPDYLFRDGTLSPGYSYYSTYTGLNPDSPRDRRIENLSHIAWQALEQAARNAATARKRGVTLTGVVKRPGKPIFALLIDWVFKDIIPGYKLGTLRNDIHALNLIMDDGDITCALGINTKWSVLGGISSDWNQIKKVLDEHLGERYTSPYTDNLEALNHYSFYLNVAGISTRYDFIVTDNPAKQQRALSEVAYKLSGPVPRLIGSKKFEIIPSLVATADKEANLWVKSLGNMIEDRLIRAIYRGFRA